MIAKEAKNQYSYDLFSILCRDSIPLYIIYGVNVLHYLVPSIIEDLGYLKDLDHFMYICDMCICSQLISFKQIQL